MDGIVDRPGDTRIARTDHAGISLPCGIVPAQVRSHAASGAAAPPVNHVDCSSQQVVVTKKTSGHASRRKQPERKDSVNLLSSACGRMHMRARVQRLGQAQSGFLVSLQLMPFHCSAAKSGYLSITIASAGNGCICSQRCSSIRECTPSLWQMWTMCVFTV